MNNPPNPAVTVTQADREAAYSLMLDYAGDAWSGLLQGKEDRHCFVQAFARHRQSIPAAGVGEGLREAVAYRFGGVEYSPADLEIAQRAACAIVPLYGTGDHGEQEAAREGNLWNDHPAVQGALRALYEVRLAAPISSASEGQEYDPAQIAFDQQCDDPAPGGWNDACVHIAKELRELKPAALSTPPEPARDALLLGGDAMRGEGE